MPTRQRRSPEDSTSTASASGPSEGPSRASIQAGAGQGVELPAQEGGSETPFLDQAEEQMTASHTVRRGENLTTISRKYGVTVADMLEFNHLPDPDMLSIGQTLKVPSKRTEVGAEPVPPAAPEPEMAFVRRGETLGIIARRYGVTVQALAKENGITNVNFVRIGQPLKIPTGGTGPSTTPERAPTSSGSGGGRDVSPEVAEATGLSTGRVDEEQIQNAPALQSVVDSVLRVAPRHDFARGAIPGILRQCAAMNVRNAAQVAYILATADHESDFGKPTYGRSETLVEDSNPYQQSGSGLTARNHVSGRRVNAQSRDEMDKKYWDDAYGHKLGNRKGTSDASNYRGRGYVQLTGRENYDKMTKDLVKEKFTYELDGVVWGRDKPIDLLANPTHVNRHKELAARVLVDGMMEGRFTGSELDDHVNDQKTDFYNARSVVNGDKGKNGRSIQQLARTYQGSLGGWGGVFRPVA